MFEINLDTLPEVTSLSYHAVSKYPSIRRDLALLVNDDISLGMIQNAIESIDNDILQKLDVFDVYRGETIAEGKKSIALGLTLQHTSRTLVEQEVNAFVDAILIKLQEKFNIMLRE